MICENVWLTWKRPGPHGYASLDTMTRCTAEATTVRASRDQERKHFCAPCAESLDGYRERLDAAVLDARRKRGEICGQYGVTDPYAIEPGDLCARWVYTDPDDARGLFEVLTKPESRRIERGSKLDDDRPYTWMENLHGRTVWQLRGRLIESGREGWIFYRSNEWFWRKEEREVKA
ncbi:hypothetical protein [Streptomyces sp. NRRL S-920]|uniref:hypothetical protein n=1 Tax=Streptomyces sp. NRRL S-920 TaxID=1463921 RepID=UPI0004C87550|nr:hypothetical protein [Streptomyces sp. NRRL S-920]